MQRTLFPGLHNMLKIAKYWKAQSSWNGNSPVETIVYEHRLYFNEQKYGNWFGIK